MSVWCSYFNEMKERNQKLKVFIKCEMQVKSNEDETKFVNQNLMLVGFVKEVDDYSLWLDSQEGLIERKDIISSKPFFETKKYNR
jgi:hypothetical protein